MKSKLIVFLVSLVVLSGCSDNAPVSEFVRQYEVIEIAPADIDLQSSYPASINGRQDIDIYPKISGFIEKVSFTEGQHVKKGQTLFVIEQVQYQAALQTAQANVEAAKAGVATAQLTFDSKKELFNREIISQFELSMAENQLLTAKAQLAQAEAQETDARNNLSYTIVKSPADGIVGTIPFREGTLVSPSMPKPLTTVSDNSSMFVYFSMTENQLLGLLREYGSAHDAIEEMPDINLRLNDGSIYGHTGRIETISGVIDPTTGTVSLRAIFPNSEGLLRSGGSGNVIMPYSYTNSIIIPQSITFDVQDKIYVYKVVDGVAAQAPVTVSKISNGVDYIVESGLAYGDVVISEGVGMLRNGTPVQIKK
ncbi:MAG: efflux RND transporter periplasmic adaptor subunit [Rikenellaceae bacterium]|nr:efflux RND transporter periplasmic adaptor subunit [Rikenellaceae bacterium]